MVRVELYCSAVASTLAPEAPMELDLRLRVVRVELCCSAVANALIPEAPIWLPRSLREVRVELCCSAVANTRAPESPIVLPLRSRVVKDGSFERSRESGCSSLEEKEEAAMFKVTKLFMSKQNF